MPNRLERIAERIEAGELISDKSMSDREFLAPLLEEPCPHGSYNFGPGAEMQIVCTLCGETVYP